MRATSGRAANACDDFASAFHQNRVNDIEGAMLKPMFAQPLQDWSLRGLAFVQQAVIHVPALFSLGVQGRGGTQIGLVGEDNEKFCLLSIGSVFHHPWRDFLWNESAELLWHRRLICSGEHRARTATAPVVAITAATRNNEQEIRRHSDGMNVWCGCVVIGALSCAGLL